MKSKTYIKLAIDELLELLAEDEALVLREEEVYQERQAWRKNYLRKLKEYAS